MNNALLEDAWRFHRAGEHDKALALYQDILRADPRNLEALQGLGFLHGQYARWEQAQQLMGKAIEIAPHSPGLFLLRGSALQKLMRHEEAIGCFDRALALNPKFPEALLNRAASLFRLRRYVEAGDDYGRLLEIDPEFPFAQGNRLFCRLHCCDWRSLDEESAAIAAALRKGRRVIAPFDAKALFLSPEDELACARIWAADQYPGPSAPSAGAYDHQKIRVAYLSADFREGPVAALMAGVFEGHDKDRFEIVAILLTPDDHSAIRARLEDAFGTFVDAHDKSDSEIASLLRQTEIDVAVDLMGYTEGGRPGILRSRPAPVQVGFLGFPGTTGSDWLDYLIADRTVAPPEHARFFTEKIVRLPGCYLPRDSANPITGNASRSDERLPQNGFVFASFNNTYKFNPTMFDIWMRLLREVDGSVLWLPRSNPIAMRNLTNEAVARGIAADRLVFADYKDSAEDHLRRLQLADLFLDTLPYNAHSTASDALWAGVPVLSCLGATFAGRVAASLLYALDLPELVTASLAEYEAKALRLARDPAQLADIRAKLAKNRASSSLFDSGRFARHLESAFATMWERSRRGLPSDGFAVTP